MKIKQTILLLLALGTATHAFAGASGQDSLRCARHTLDMTPEEDGCSGNYCKRSAFVCVPRAWWSNGELSIPGSAKAPLVLAFHGRSLQTPTENTNLWNAIHASPEAGIFGYDTNLHGAMPGAIVVYFQGLPVNDDWTPNTDAEEINENSAARGWQVNPSSDKSLNRDITFVNKFVNLLVNNSSSQLQNHIDLENIFAVGYSNGSRFAGVLWNHTSTSNPLQRSRLKSIAFVAAQAGDFPASSNPENVEGEDLFKNADKRTSLFMTMGLKDTVKVPFSIQQASIAKAEALLGIDLPLTENQAEDLQGSNGPLKLRVLKHDRSDGHGWPEDQAGKIASFFGL